MSNGTPPREGETGHIPHDMAPDHDRQGRVLELYDLMQSLSEEHSADDARLERVSDTRAAIVLEFDTPAPNAEE